MTEQAGRRWIGGAFTAATLVWVLAILLAPAAGRESGGRAATAVAAGTYLLGSVVCHQLPDRSFHPGGVQMPVCARCTGLYLGGGMGVLLAGVRRRRGVGPGRASLATATPAPAWLRWAVVVAAVPTAASFAAEMAGWMPSIGELRAVAGVPLGVAVTWVASLVIRGDLA